MQDERSGVQTLYQSQPRDTIVDPVLSQIGITGYRYSPDGNHDENLFPKFRKRDRPKRFFSVGKVFLVLWVEPMGESALTNLVPGESVGSFGERVFSKVRRFVVVREGDTYCTCLAIVHHGNYGIGKSGVEKSDHGIVYTGQVAPEPLLEEAPRRGEEGMRPEPIRINSDDPTGKLDAASRLDYRKVYTIEHNIKVKSFGQVHPGSMNELVYQFGNMWNSQPVLGYVGIQDPQLDASSVSSGRRGSTQRRESHADSPNRTRRRESYSASLSRSTDFHGETKQSNAPHQRSDSNLETGDVARVDTLQQQVRAAMSRLIEQGYSEANAVAAMKAVWQEKAGGLNGTEEDDEDNDDNEDDDSDEEGESEVDQDSNENISQAQSGQVGHPTGSQSGRQARRSGYSQAGCSNASVQMGHGQTHETKTGTVTATNASVIGQPGASRTTNAQRDERTCDSERRVSATGWPTTGSQIGVQHLSNAKLTSLAPSVQTDSGYRTESRIDQHMTAHLAQDDSQDSRTVVTDDESLHITLETKERLIQSFVDYLTNDLSQHRHLAGRNKAIGVSQQLLRDFAELQNYRAQTSTEKDAAVFSRRFRARISKCLTNALKQETLKWGGTRDVIMSIEEKLDKWPWDPSTADQELVPYSEDNLSELEEITESANESYPEILDVQRFLLSGDEYEWLLYRTISSTVMDTNQYNRSSGIREAFFADLATINHQAGTQAISLELGWSVREYMIHQFDSLVDLGATLVIVGTPTEAYVTTCQEYVTKMWPIIGPGTLSAIQDASAANGESVDGRIKDLVLQIQVGKDKTSVHATGKLVYLCEMLEVLVWMGAACRSSDNEQDLSTCKPVFTRQSDSTGLYFKVEFSNANIAHEEKVESCAMCWHKMFQGGVIAEGYPIPTRAEHERGLEVSLGLMVALARTPSQALYEGHALLKGYNSMLLPVHKEGHSVQWHFLTSGHPKTRMSFNECLSFPTFTSFDDVMSDSARHFVGWCRDTRILAG